MTDLPRPTTRVPVPVIDPDPAAWKLVAQRRGEQLDAAQLPPVGRWLDRMPSR